MGRTEKSQGLAPPAIRKDARAKQARNIVNKVIPAILASNPRARGGVDNSELISNPSHLFQVDASEKNKGGEDVAYVKKKGQRRRNAKAGTMSDEEDLEAPITLGKAKKSGKRRNEFIDEDLSSLTLTKNTTAPASLKRERAIRIVTTDSLTAARMLISTEPTSNKKTPNVCILNMASPLRPGGGVLFGATSQEEFLCARTTLLPSLKESFYRLPELGGVFTPDVLVFRSSAPLGDSKGELGLGERYWVSVISAGMLRFPDLEGEVDEAKTLAKKDRKLVEEKMRAVLRIASAKGLKKLVLGAWGCGAYGNPVADIAQAWKQVLSGTSCVDNKKGKAAVASETWPGLEEILFAIPNQRMAADFASAFGDGIEVESGPQSSNEDDDQDNEEEKITQELQNKIGEMESQIGKVYNADLKSRLSSVLDGLKEQLRQRQGDGHDSNTDSTDISEDGEDSEGYVEQLGQSLRDPVEDE